MGAFCESGLVIAVVTIATVGVRCGRTEAGRAGVAAAFSTRGIVLVVRTGVTVSVCNGRHTSLGFHEEQDEEPYRCSEMNHMCKKVHTGASLLICKQQEYLRTIIGNYTCSG